MYCKNLQVSGFSFLRKSTKKGNFFSDTQFVFLASRKYITTWKPANTSKQNSSPYASLPPSWYSFTWAVRRKAAAVTRLEKEIVSSSAEHLHLSSLFVYRNIF